MRVGVDDPIECRDSFWPLAIVGAVAARRRRPADADLARRRRAVERDAVGGQRRSVCRGRVGRVGGRQDRRLRRGQPRQRRDVWRAGAGQHDRRRGAARRRAAAARGADASAADRATRRSSCCGQRAATATAIKTARSRDGGRTFEPPVALQAADAAGDRGWPSLALDSRGTAHAIWLDHRGLAAARAAGASRDHRSGAAHDGVAMAQKSGLYYAAGTRHAARPSASWPRASATAARPRWPSAPVRRCMPRGGTSTRATSATSRSRPRATAAGRLPRPFA